MKRRSSSTWTNIIPLMTWCTGWDMVDTSATEFSVISKMIHVCKFLRIVAIIRAGAFLTTSNLATRIAVEPFVIA